MHACTWRESVARCMSYNACATAAPVACSNNNQQHHPGSVLGIAHSDGLRMYAHRHMRLPSTTLCCLCAPCRHLFQGVHVLMGFTCITCMRTKTSASLALHCNAFARDALCALQARVPGRAHADGLCQQRRRSGQAVGGRWAVDAVVYQAIAFSTVRLHCYCPKNEIPDH